MTRAREGYSTGTCAAAAAKAAAAVLSGHPAPGDVDVLLPDGSRARLAVAYARCVGDMAEAAVRKDAGDDPDITDGKTVVAAVRWSAGTDVAFAAGDGVGTITRPGLQLAPGEPAINPVPRRMIRHAVRDVTDRDVIVTVSIPGGKQLAEKTFNPRLGIVGGLSILGTTGRVRPFSHPALQAALKCGVDVAAACGIASPVLVPGHVGERAAHRHFELLSEQVIEVSNEWGYMLSLVAQAPFRAILALGHPGKLAKLAEREWDTHSSRSGSAVPAVARVAEAVLGRTLPDSPTVEGLFAALAPDESRRLADALAARVCEQIAAFLHGARHGVAVVLVNMRGEWLGSHGDLRPWHKRG